MVRKRRGPGVQPIVEYWRLRFFVHVFVNKVFVKACRIRRVMENVFGFFPNYRREGEKDSRIFGSHWKREAIMSETLCITRSEKRKEKKSLPKKKKKELLGRIFSH